MNVSQSQEAMWLALVTQNGDIIIIIIIIIIMKTERRLLSDFSYEQHDVCRKH
jgi:hypothetical protein